ncbi:hypothetical protein L4D77_19265 [Photobacterium frigidiphilum]|uniref:hypothetical protein n=1 Tax=Photobacterium frigidiphilum TaxID=264736 RepID=UPI003D11BFD2
MTQRGLATIKFFEHKETIEKRMHKLRFVKIVYRELKDEGIIDYSYEQFRTLCNKYILDGCNNSDAKKTSIKTKQQTKKPAFTSKPKQTGFIHNPSIDAERMKELFGE